MNASCCVPGSGKGGCSRRMSSELPVQGELPTHMSTEVASGAGDTCMVPHGDTQRLFFLSNKKIIILYVWVFCPLMCIRTTDIATDDGEPPCWCWELNPICWKQQKTKKPTDALNFWAISLAPNYKLFSCLFVTWLSSSSPQEDCSQAQPSSTPQSGLTPMATLNTITAASYQRLPGHEVFLRRPEGAADRLSFQCLFHSKH